MGIQEAAKFGAMGFIADRILGTGTLATLMGAGYGGMFRPDAGEMSAAYDKRKATVGDTLKSFFGYDMADGLFGSAAKTGHKPEDLRANPERAAQQAEAREKKDGFPWGKALLAGGAAVLGVNLLDNLVTGPFSAGLFAPLGLWNNVMPGLGYGGYGMNSPFAYGGVNPLNGILPIALTALLGLGRCNVLF